MRKGQQASRPAATLSASRPSETPHAALIDFTTRHFSREDCARFLSLVARGPGDDTLDLDVRVRLERIVKSELDSATAERYLAELRRRLNAGEPLIQRQPARPTSL